MPTGYLGRVVLLVVGFGLISFGLPFTGEAADCFTLAGVLNDLDLTGLVLRAVVDESFATFRSSAGFFSSSKL